MQMCCVFEAAGGMLQGMQQNDGSSTTTTAASAGDCWKTIRAFCSVRPGQLALMAGPAPLLMHVLLLTHTLPLPVFALAALQMDLVAGGLEVPLFHYL